MLEPGGVRGGGFEVIGASYIRFRCVLMFIVIVEWVISKSEGVHPALVNFGGDGQNRALSMFLTHGLNLGGIQPVELHTSHQRMTDSAPTTWIPLFQQHERALILFARRWADFHVDAEDMVQEALLRVLRVQPENVGDPLAYLYTCVRNVGNEFKRTLNRRTKREESVASDRGVESMFECPFEGPERTTALQAAIARLSPVRQEVVMLKIWSGMTFPQIGDVLEISPNTAASRYRHALIELRETLGRTGTVR